MIFFGGDNATQQEVSAQLLEAHAGVPAPESVVQLHQDQCLKNRNLYRGVEFLDMAPQLLGDKELDQATRNDFLKWLGRIARGVSR